MTRHENTYYLMYGAPGTEFNVYGDGVYTSDSPLGPFSYAPNNPVALKPGGFMNGAGHSSHVEGPQDTYWHFGTMALSLNVNWERRIGMWRSYFDKDGLMHTDTYFGDYPHFVPSFPGKPGDFAGWMLLSFHKPVKASSQVGEHSPEKVVDEDCKSYWLAQSAGDDQWIEIDLEDPANVYAIQVNYQDHQSDIYGKVPELYHRYVIEGSLDRTTWEVLADRRNNFLDVPNDYIELSSGKKSRYIRFRNIHVPTSHLAISGLRVFGKGEGKKPGKVSRFTAERMEDERNALLKWEKQKNSQGYNILWGIAPDKLYSSWMIYDENELELRSLTKGQSYYFTIEAFNENGVSERVKTIKIE